MSRLKRLADRIGFLFSSTEARRRLWPPAPRLTEQHLRNCRVLPDRLRMLDEIPKQGVCAELGIFKCDFSEQILQKLKPSVLHLIDIDPESIRIAEERFSEEIADGRVVIHHQDSSTALLSLPEDTFDWIYIDGDHSYRGVQKDLQAAHRKLKPDGLISLNDYLFFGSSDLYKYGVIEAVNEFCLEYRYEILYLALHGRMYNDVTLRRIS
ncbi:MAG: class I SAM-dependent methyltransferase [Balneolaceae bacterium]